MCPISLSLSLSMPLFVLLSVPLSLSLFIFHFIWPSLCVSVPLSVHSVCHSFCMSFFWLSLSHCPFLHLFFSLLSLSLSLSLSPSACPSLCLSLSLTVPVCLSFSLSVALRNCPCPSLSFSVCFLLNVSHCWSLPLSDCSFLSLSLSTPVCGPLFEKVCSLSILLRSWVSVYIIVLFYVYSLFVSNLSFWFPLLLFASLYGACFGLLVWLVQGCWCVFLTGCHHGPGGNGIWTIKLAACNENCRRCQCFSRRVQFCCGWSCGARENVVSFQNKQLHDSVSALLQISLCSN